MSGGEAFFIQAASEVAVREHLAKEQRRRGRPPDLARRLPKRTVAEVVVAIVVSMVIAVMAAVGGMAAVPVTDEGCLIGEAGTCTPPDILTICREELGLRRCHKEPT